MVEKTAKRLLSIGQLVEELRAECPEVTRSMLRFWEKEGLISPARSPGGHRKYRTEDVERLRLVAQLRWRRYLPLTVVKHIIGQLESDPTYDLSLYDEVFHPDGLDPNFEPLNLTQAARQTGLSVEEIKNLEQLGFLPAWERDEHPRIYQEEDVRVLESINELINLGFSVTDLSFYVKDIQAHVKNESDMLTQFMQGTIEDPEHRSLYRKLESNIRQLRSILYRKYGRRALGDLLDKN